MLLPCMRGYFFHKTTQNLEPAWKNIEGLQYSSTISIETDDISTSSTSQSLWFHTSFCWMQCRTLRISKTTFEILKLIIWKIKFSNKIFTIPKLTFNFSHLSQIGLLISEILLNFDNYTSRTALVRVRFRLILGCFAAKTDFTSVFLGSFWTVWRSKCSPLLQGFASVAKLL